MKLFIRQKKWHKPAACLYLIIALFFFSRNVNAQAFITTWQTTDSQITIPTTGGGYTYDIVWTNLTNATVGDGSITGQTGDYTITGLANGDIYQVEIIGTFPRIYFNNTGDKDKILTVEQWGDISWSNMAFAFYGCTSLTVPAADAPDLSGVNSLKQMFQGATSFNQSIDHWNVGTIVEFYGMFWDATAFNQPLNSWNMSGAYDISAMFNGATSFNQPLDNWVTTGLTDIKTMFKNASSFNQSVNNFDVSLVADFAGTFEGATAFNQPLDNWNTSSATSMALMFYNASSFNQPIGNWDVSGVTNMSYMFSNAINFDQDLGSWDIGLVTNMSDMLWLTNLSVSNYDNTLIGWATIGAGESQIPSGITSFRANGLFYCNGETARQDLISTYGWAITLDMKNCTPFTTTWQTTDGQITIPTTGGGYSYDIVWTNLTNATVGDGSITGQTGDYTITGLANGDIYQVEITGVFPRIFFNNTGDKDKILTVEYWGDIQWSSMNSAFYGCTNLTVPAVDAPDLTNAISLQQMFQGALSFNQSIDHWDVSGIVSFYGMFENASSYNQPLNSWTLTNAQDISSMFNGATSFNQPLDNWVTTGITDIKVMFKNASSFNQPVNHFDVSLVSDFAGTFEGASSFDQPLNNWNMSSATTLALMFYNNSSFNQPIGNWDVSGVSNFSYMFANATSYNQNLGNWDISNATNMTDMLWLSNLSTANYDNTLIGWATLDVGEAQIPTGITTFRANGLTYCSSAAERQDLIDNYSWAITLDTQSVSCEPSMQASNIIFSTITTTQMDVSWTNGNGTNRLVVAHEGSSVDTDPSDLSTYAANLIFGSGSEIGTGNYVIYNGSGNSLTLTGLTQGTAYYFRVYEYYGTAGSENYTITTATGNPANTTTLVPTPLNLTSSTPSSNGTNIIVSSNITMDFDADVNLSSVNNGTSGSTSVYDDNITILGNQSGQLEGVYSIGGDNSIIVFDPSIDFHAGEKITVIVSSSVLGTGGEVAVASSFSFTALTGPYEGNFIEKTSGILGMADGSFDWGDYDNDGDLDLVVVGFDPSYNTQAAIYRNDNGTFTDIGAGLTGVFFSSVEWGDYDNDGDLDLALAGMDDTYTNRVTIIYRNDGGVFTDISAGLLGVDYSSLDWGDYDNDGDLDLVVIGRYSTGPDLASSTIYQNNGGVFTDIGAGLQALNNGSVDWGDYDGDGDLDLVMTGFDSSWSNRYTIIYDNNAGVFTDHSAGIPGVAWGDTDWGDYDNDGDLDLFLLGDGSVLTYTSIFNNSGGVFTDIGAGFPTTSEGSVRWGDYDGDGDLDVVITGQDYSMGTEITNIYNNSGGTFTDINAGLQTVYFTGLADWGDYDGDGDLDLFIAGESSSTPSSTQAVLYENASLPFTTTWQTTDGQITIPTTGAGYNYDIVWTNLTNTGVGDGSITGQTGDYTITGIENGSTYQIEISGIFPQIHINNSGDKDKIRTIEQWGDISWASMSNAFNGCTNLTYNASDAPDLSLVIDMSNMFRGASSFNGDISSWDVSNVQNFSFMFYGAVAFNQPIGGWIVTSADNMQSMFQNASAFNQNLNSWSPSNVINMQSMFQNAIAFNGQVDGWDITSLDVAVNLFNGASSFNQTVESWNVTGVSDMRGMFANATVFNQPLNGWGIKTSSVDNMNRMFQNAVAFNQPLNAWDVSTVQHMSYMFSGATSFNQDLNAWVPSSCLDIQQMFEGATVFNGALDGWGSNTGLITNMLQTFSGASSFNQPLDSWDVSSVQTMDGMFQNADVFNQNLNNWTTSSCENMARMFNGAVAFNGAIDAWDLSLVTNITSMFNGAISFNQPIGNWGTNTGLVQTMVGVFFGATSFDQPLDTWDVGSVTNMQSMFRDATSFNQDLSSWNTSSVNAVLGMYYMFGGATTFNGDITTWDVSNCQSFQGMFLGATSFNQNLGAWDISSGTSINFGGTAMSISSYDATLIGWLDDNGGTETIPSGFTVNASGVFYCASETERQTLIDTHGWIINDTGKACPIPNDPTDLFTTEVSPNQINLTWADNATYETGFTIERSDDNNLNFVALNTVGVDVTTFSDNTVTADNGYFYRVIANGSSGDSNPSNEKFGSTFTPPHNALDFDGIDDYVDLGDPNEVDFGSGDFTLELWFKPNDLSDGNRMLIAKDEGASGNRQFALQYNPDAYPGQKKLRVLYYRDNTTAVGYDTGDNAINDTNWHHIAAMRKGGIFEVYVDGVLIGSGNVFDTPGAMQATSAKLVLGTFSDLGSGYVNGQIDEVRIWNVARTQTQLQSYMFTSLAGNQSNLVAYYKFDQGIPNGDNTSPLVDVLPDRSSNNNDGSLSGFALNGLASNWVNSNALQLLSPELEVYTGIDNSGVAITDAQALPVDFGSAVQTTDITQTFAIENTGTADLNISGISVTGTDFTVSSALTAISAGTTETFTITLSGASTGTFNSTVSIVNDDSNENPFTFNITGTITAAPEPEINLFAGTDNTGAAITDAQPTAIDFGSAVQTTDITQTFAIENTGTADLNISGISVTGTDFTVSSALTAISAGTTETFTITLSGASTGTFNSTVSIVNDDSNENPFTFDITGTITATPEPEITVFLGNDNTGTAITDAQAGTIDFSSAVQGSDITQTFAIENIGSADLNISSISVSGTDYSITSVITTITAGTTETFTVTLSGASVGTFNTTLTIANDDSDENPFTFDITGTISAIPAPEINVFAGADNTGTVITDAQTTAIDFGSALQGTDVTQTFAIENTGSANLTVNSISVGGTDYSVTSSISTILAGVTETFTITLSGANTGTFNTTVNIDNDDSDENPFTFDITGSIDGVIVKEDDNNGGGVVISNQTVDLGSTVVNVDIDKIFVIENPSTSNTLTVNNITSDNTAFEIIEAPASIPPASFDQFIVRLLASEAGNYSGNVSVSTNLVDFEFIVSGEVVGETFDDIHVYNVVTPNGDGVHDYLKIENITNYPDNRVIIYNRWGDKVFEATTYDNQSVVFNGIDNVGSERELDTGNFYYSIDKGNGEKIITGFLFLKR